jgi:hypothetical protein
MKRNYRKPKFNIYLFDEEDVILTGSDLGDGDVGEMGGDDSRDWDDWGN